MLHALGNVFRSEFSCVKKTNLTKARSVPLFIFLHHLPIFRSKIMLCPNKVFKATQNALQNVPTGKLFVHQFLYTNIAGDP